MTCANCSAVFSGSRACPECGHIHMQPKKSAKDAARKSRKHYQRDTDVDETSNARRQPTQEEKEWMQAEQRALAKTPANPDPERVRRLEEMMMRTGYWEGNGIEV